MNTKHTPGPWKWDGVPGESDLRYEGEPGDSDGCVIRYAPHEGMWMSAYGQTGVDEANARLIAAAPELLEALVEAREWNRGDKWRGTDKHDAWQAQMDKYDAAIAKAKGEA